MLPTPALNREADQIGYIEIRGAENPGADRVKEQRCIFATHKKSLGIKPGKIKHNWDWN